MTLPSDTRVRTPDGSPLIQPALAGDGTESLDVTVVICAYTEERWDQTKAALRSVLTQEPPSRQTLLVIDHNDRLAARARREYPGLTVLESDGEPGLSGARNTGLGAAAGAITVFLDDDAVARPGWLASLIEPYRDARVMATGGSVYPLWCERQPRWLPPEFYWVVGCSYRGLPETLGVVRNPIGANMSMRTAQAIDVGGFLSTVGRTASKPRGCEETELAIRLTSAQPGLAVIYSPAAAVDHNVSRDRLRFSYFVRRCWHEGRSKAIVVSLAGADAGLQRERRQVASVIPAAVLRDLRQFAQGDGAALARASMTIIGLAATVAGYCAGTLRLAIGSRAGGGATRG